MVAVLVPEFLQIEAFRDLYHELLAVEFQALFSRVPFAKASMFACDLSTTACPSVRLNLK